MHNCFYLLLVKIVTVVVNIHTPVSSVAICHTFVTCHDYAPKMQPIAQNFKYQHLQFKEKVFRIF